MDTMDEFAEMGYIKPFGEEYEEYKRKKRLAALENEEEKPRGKNIVKDDKSKDSSQDVDLLDAFDLSPEELAQLRESDESDSEGVYWTLKKYRRLINPLEPFWT